MSERVIFDPDKSVELARKALLNAATAKDGVTAEEIVSKLEDFIVEIFCREYDVNYALDEEELDALRETHMSGAGSLPANEADI